VEAEKPDITVALVHWGSEYNDDISSSQEYLVSLMKKNGVDIILGTHSHTLQPIDYDPLKGTLVAYSLGDFFGDASRSGTQYSILLDMKITKDYDTGITRITDWSFVPIYTLAENECDGDRRVVRVENAMSAYELNFVDKVTASCYDNLAFALDRINARIAPPTETEKK
jgi:poly-gamma-glutamate synthesis protein (capsule biosynthesis protein)